jgi:hypothetical protein
MSACALRRWGSGTPCVKESGVEKEMSQKLAAMRAEREKQDGMWHSLTKSTQDVDGFAAPKNGSLHEPGTRK